LIHINSIYSSR